MALTLLWFVLCTAAAVIAEELVNCTVDETPVPEGSFVSIKCVFTFDIAKGRDNFSVSRTDNTGFTISVVDCKWNSRTENHTCLDKGTGYQVQSITSEVRILILRATTIHTGNYTCHVANRTIRANPCTLVVTEVPFKTSCSAPKVQEGSTAEVICEFNKNLKQLKAEFLVIKQPLLAHGYDNESAVIDCSWKDDKLECDKQEGYTIDESAVTSTFILRINSASSEQEGRYTCRAHSSLQPDETPCELNFKPGQTTVGKRDSERSQTHHPHVTVTFALIITVTCIVVCGIVGGIYLVLAFKKKWCPFSNPCQNNVPNTPQEMPLITAAHADEPEIPVAGGSNGNNQESGDTARAQPYVVESAEEETTM